MSSAAFLSEAAIIAGRNLTDNVRAVSASLNNGHLSVTYHTATEPTDEDEEERELTVGELIAAFPEIRTADASSQLAEERLTPLSGEQVVFLR